MKKCILFFLLITASFSSFSKSIEATFPGCKFNKNLNNYRIVSLGKFDSYSLALRAKEAIEDLSRSEVVFREEVFNNISILTNARGNSYVTISCPMQSAQSVMKSIRISNRIKLFESIDKYSDLKELGLKVSLINLID